MMSFTMNSKEMETQHFLQMGSCLMICILCCFLLGLPIQNVNVLLSPLLQSLLLQFKINLNYLSLRELGTPRQLEHQEVQCHDSHRPVKVLLPSFPTSSLCQRSKSFSKFSAGSQLQSDGPTSKIIHELYISGQRQFRSWLGNVVSDLYIKPNATVNQYCYILLKFLSDMDHPSIWSLW